MIYWTDTGESGDRRERAAKERSAGWALLQQAIKELKPQLYGKPLKEILEAGPHGKPFIKGNPFFFNISHSGGIAVCAVESCPVGVDIEKKREFSIRLKNRICTVGELTLIEKSHNEHHALTQLWTMKESYMKYTGLGMAQGILSTEFISLGEKPQLKTGDAFFTSMEFHGAYLTLCTEKPCEITFKEITKAEING